MCPPQNKKNLYLKSYSNKKFLQFRLIRIFDSITNLKCNKNIYLSVFECT